MYQHIQPYIEIMDTTLRDGEQTDSVSFVPREKLNIARLLLQDLNVDRIEVASARVSDGEKEAVRLICHWAEDFGLLDRVEVLGFVDEGKSLQWLRDCGCRHINLLAKGSRNHCRYQLHKDAAEHIDDIRRELDLADRLGIGVNLYLEDWSSGMKDSPDFVYQMMDGLKDTPIKRFLLPDTLGILNPLSVIEYMRKMVKRYPDVHFDFHAHNDYDLAISNVLAAVLSGCKGIHSTINGLGERAGNAPLASVQAILHDQFDARTSIREENLYKVSRMVETYSGITIPPNQPVVGESVFTQVAGVHADGDNKHGLYQNDLLPERFGRRREYALGKNSGKANIQRNLEDLGLELTPEQTRQVTARITELGDRKEIVTPDDLPYIVSDVIKHTPSEARVKLISYLVSTAHGLHSHASLRIEINGTEYEVGATGDGQFDAFVRGLRDIYHNRLHRDFPVLTNYFVTIPPGGRTDALVQTIISWNYHDKVIRTRGLDADQTDSAIKATIKMLNVLENMANDTPSPVSDSGERQ